MWSMCLLNIPEEAKMEAHNITDALSCQCTVSNQSLGVWLSVQQGYRCVVGSNLWPLLGPGRRLTAVWVSPPASGGSRTDAGRSNRRPRSSTPRSTAGGGRAASVATATEGRWSHRRSPRQPVPAGRQTPEDEAEYPGRWEEKVSNLITKRSAEQTQWLCKALWVLE